MQDFIGLVVVFLVFFGVMVSCCWGVIKFLEAWDQNLARKKYLNYDTRHYVYVFVRQDISPEYQAVQAAHVTMQMGAELGEVDGLYFSLIGVKDGGELLKVAEQLEQDDIGYTKFIEPDIGSEVTAICTVPIPHDERGWLLDLKRLKFKYPKPAPKKKAKKVKTRGRWSK